MSNQNLIKGLSVLKKDENKEISINTKVNNIDYNILNKKILIIQEEKKIYMTIVLKAMKVMMKKILWIKVIVMKIIILKQEIEINIIFNLEKLEEKKNQINKKNI